MKRRLSFIFIAFITLFALRFMGFTYGFFGAIINGNLGNNDILLNTKYLNVEYSDGTSQMNFKGDFLFPGNTAEKTFTVKNTGDDDTKYNILIDNVVNEFERIQDLRYELYINDDLIETGAVNLNDKQYLYYDRTLEKGKTDYVKFIFLYSETEEIQNMDLNKTISFRFNIDSYLSNEHEFVGNDFVFKSEVTNLNNYRIYGNSVNGDNVLKYPYIHTTRTISGITFTDNGDGSITANGTATATVKFHLQKIKLSEYIGYTISGGYDEGSPSTFWIGLNTVGTGDRGEGLYINRQHANLVEEDTIVIRVASGYVADNVVIKPQLQKGDKSEWISQVPTPDNPLDIKSVGEKSKNLLNSLLIKSSNFDIAYQDDGSVTLNGTTDVTANVVYIEDTIGNIGLKANTDYTIHHIANSSGIVSGRVAAIGIYNVTTGVGVNSKETGTTFQFDNETDVIRIRINFAANTVLNDYNIKLQIEEGSTATEYEPYGKYNIPIKVRGKNLAHPNGRNFTVNGITLTTNKDGTVTLTGKATESISTILMWCGRSASNKYYHDFVLYPGEKVKGSIINVDTGELAKFSYHLQWTGVETGKTYYGSPNFSEPVYLDRIYTHTTLTAGENIYEGTWKVQLEKGEAITEYEPYFEYSTNIFLDEPLRRVGDYADYIDFKNQKVVRIIKYFDFLNTQSWRTYMDGNGKYQTIVLNNKGMIDRSGGVNCMSNTIPCITRNDMYHKGTYGVSTSLGTIRVFYPPITDTLVNFQDFLSSNSTYINYILEQEVEQYIKLPSILTNVGNNSIEIDTEVLPSNLYIEY